jgi:hypothetical protein
MSRWILVLLIPLCLALQDVQPGRNDSRRVREVEEEKITVRPVVVLQEAELRRQNALAALALATPQTFPASVPWAPVYDLGANGLYPLDALLQYHPLLFLEMCIARYDREVKGYSCTFHKQEFIAEKLQKLEILKVHFREQPFSVFMEWIEGTRLAKRALYVAGENNNKLVARPFLTFLPIQERNVDDADAKKSGRYTIDQFGMHLGTKRTVAGMQAAQARGELHLTYHGLVKVEKAGDRICHKFVRTPYVPLEEEGVNELTLYVDQETWLQVGSVLKDAKGQLIAEYFFRDVQINPEFGPDTFTRKAL